MNCIIPGSFDPLTKGHEDIIKRCSLLFDRVIVAVSDNPEKKSVSSEIRTVMIKKVFTDSSNVTVTTNRGLTAEFALKYAPCVIVKGIRGEKDFDYEADMAKYNRELFGVETLLLNSRDEFCRISSSRIRELAYYGCDITGYVPESICGDIMAVYGRKEDVH